MHALILMAGDVLVALAVVVAKAPYIHQSDSSILVLLQTRMIKCGKVSDKLEKLFILQNIANLQGIGLTLDFGFKTYKDLTKSATFQFGFTLCVCLKRTKRTQ